MTSKTPDQTKAKVSVPVLVGFLLTLVVPLLWVFIISPLVKPLLNSQAFMIAGEVVFWGLAFGVIAVVVFWERQPLEFGRGSRSDLERGAVGITLEHGFVCVGTDLGDHSGACDWEFS